MRARRRPAAGCAARVHPGMLVPSRRAWVAALALLSLGALVQQSQRAVRSPARRDVTRGHADAVQFAQAHAHDGPAPSPPPPPVATAAIAAAATKMTQSSSTTAAAATTTTTTAANATAAAPATPAATPSAPPSAPSVASASATRPPPPPPPSPPAAEPTGLAKWHAFGTPLPTPVGGRFLHWVFFNRGHRQVDGGASRGGAAGSGAEPHAR